MVIGFAIVEAESPVFRMPLRVPEVALKVIAPAPETLVLPNRKPSNVIADACVTLPVGRLTRLAVKVAAAA